MLSPPLKYKAGVMVAACCNSLCSLGPDICSHQRPDPYTQEIGRQGNNDPGGARDPQEGGTVGLEDVERHPGGGRGGQRHPEDARWLPGREGGGRGAGDGGGGDGPHGGGGAGVPAGVLQAHAGRLPQLRGAQPRNQEVSPGSMMHFCREMGGGCMFGPRIIPPSR